MSSSKSGPRATSLNIVDRPIPRTKSEVNLSAFSFLISEIIQYSQSRVNSTQELEQKLSDIGYSIGGRVLELCVFRDKASRREIKLLNMLQLISSVVWKMLFGKVADGLEKSTESEDEFMISEREPLMNKFISVPSSYGLLNCAAFVAGIVKGILDGAEFGARVSAHSVPVEGQRVPRTVILIKFNADVLARERRLNG